MRKINRTIDEKYKACPIRNVIEKFGDKWSLLVLYHLNERKSIQRFLHGLNTPSLNWAKASCPMSSV